MRKAVIYARVSSKEQAEGFSIDAQVKLLREYASSKGFQITQEFTDIETAKKAGRENFGTMCKLLKQSNERIILTEKTDRLYRNFRDYVTLDDLQAEIHFVKEGSVLSKDTRSHDKLIHEIKLVMAKNFIDNLREETKKGMREKAAQGIWPTTAPVGYRNVKQADGKSVIGVDPIRSDEVIEMFEKYATGEYSLSSLPCPSWAYPQRIKKIFDNPMYYGEFIWEGKKHNGTHEPLVSREIWDTCQAVMKGHSRRKRTQRKVFPFSGLIRCGCGSLLIGRLHKGKYVYYKCRNLLSECPEAYVRQETLEAEYIKNVYSLRFDEVIAAKIKKALIDSAKDKKFFKESAVKKLRAEYDRIQRRLDLAYEDRLDGRITAIEYDNRAKEWRDIQDRINAELSGYEKADRMYMDEGLAILDLCNKAGDLFAVQAAAEKRQLIEAICLNSTWKAQSLEITWRKPFSDLAPYSFINLGVPKGI